MRATIVSRAPSTVSACTRNGRDPSVCQGATGTRAQTSRGEYRTKVTGVPSKLPVTSAGRSVDTQATVVCPCASDAGSIVSEIVGGTGVGVAVGVGVGVGVGVLVGVGVGVGVAVGVAVGVGVGVASSDVTIDVEQPGSTNRSNSATAYRTTYRRINRCLVLCRSTSDSVGSAKSFASG